MSDTLSTRRSTRYVVMPCRTDTTTGHVQRWYGVLDTMLSDLGTAEPAWCSLPGVGRLEWPDFNGALRWLNDCRAIRQREGGPAWYLPQGWYGPGFERRNEARAAGRPWDALPPGDDFA
jgi:hypothetical protein